MKVRVLSWYWNFFRRRLHRRRRLVSVCMCRSSSNGSAIIVAFTMIVPWMKSKVCRKENYIETGAFIDVDLGDFSLSLFPPRLDSGSKSREREQRQNYGLSFLFFFIFFFSSSHCDYYPCVILYLTFGRRKERKSKSCRKGKKSREESRWKGSNKKKARNENL